MLVSGSELAVVVRFTRYEGLRPERCIALMSLFDDLAEADAEAARLNAVRRDESVEYFVKILPIREHRKPAAP